MADPKFRIHVLFEFWFINDLKSWQKKLLDKRLFQYLCFFRYEWVFFLITGHLPGDIKGNKSCLEFLLAFSFYVLKLRKTYFFEMRNNTFCGYICLFTIYYYIIMWLIWHFLFSLKPMRHFLLAIPTLFTFNSYKTFANIL